jgi:hypothetical protein
MSTPLKPLTVQRLAYVRYLYREGLEQSRQPPPLRARSITSFHDAVENFIGLVAEHLGVELKPRTEFLQYWEQVKPQHDLPSKTEMKRLNDVRIALKHNGTFPSTHQIEQAREALVTFFTTVTPKVFGVDFDSVDMVDLVTQSAVAQLLRDAQTHADVGDYSMAAAGLGLAFDALLEHYSGSDTPGPKPFAFGSTIQWNDEPRLDGKAAPRHGRLAKLTEISEAAQDALRAISLGIDYPSLARFRVIVPEVYGYMDGRECYVEGESHRQLTADEYDWARHFVIESALRAASADDIARLQHTKRTVNQSTEHSEERLWTGPADSPDTE